MRPARTDQAFLACCLSLVGLSVAGLRALANPASRLSRWVDDGVRSVGPR